MTTTNTGAPAPASAERSKCRADAYADPPLDCNFPFCGCYPIADRAVEALQECGWLNEEEASDLQREVHEYIAENAALKEALRFYADPEIYKPHPHGPAFDRRDLSWRARAALNSSRRTPPPPSPPANSCRNSSIPPEPPHDRHQDRPGRGGGGVPGESPEDA